MADEIETIDVRLPDGTTVSGVPKGTTRKQLADKLVASGRSVPSEWLQDKPAKPSVELGGGPGPKAVVESIGAIVEPPVSVGSQMVAAPLSGLAGVATVASGGGPDKAVKNIESVQSHLTYRPRTKTGQKATEIVTYPLEKLAQGADWVGQKAVNDLKPLVGDKTADAAGAAVNTLIQSAPALVAKVARAPGAVKLSDAAASDAARSYVAGKTMLSWDTMPDHFKLALTKIAQHAGDLNDLDPKALQRQALLESLPVKVPATRGQLSKDPVQLRNEANIASGTTTAGKVIRDVDEASNRAILDNLDVLKGKVVRGVTGGTEEQVGSRVQGALREKEKAYERRYQQLYDIAKRNGETKEPIEIEPLLQYMDNVGDPTQVGYVTSKLDALRKQAGGKLTQLSIDQLETIRKAATAASKSGGERGYYAAEVRNVINGMTEGRGGGYYKAARQAFKQSKVEFEDQRAVRALVDDKTRTDRATALEDTWSKTVKGGSIEDLSRVKKSLLTGDDAPSRAAGRDAWRSMAGRTVQYIKDEAAKGVGRTEGGERVVTISGIDRALKSIDPEWPSSTAKLDLLLGKKNVAQLKKIHEAADVVKNDPRVRSAGSTTVQNILAFLDKTAGKIPGVGPLTTGTVRGIKNVYELGREGREARQAATQTPLSQALETSKSGYKSARSRQALKSYGTSVGATSIEAEQQ